MIYTFTDTGRKSRKHSLTFCGFSQIVEGFAEFSAGIEERTGYQKEDDCIQ